MNPIKQDLTNRDRQLFGVLLLLFAAGLGALAWWRGAALLGAATFLGAAWLFSLVFNAQDRRTQLLGALLPGLCLAIGGSVHWGAEPLSVACTVWIVGGLCGLLVLVWHAFGRAFYMGWMLAAVPIGWTISHLILGIVFFGVVTPIGLLMRLLGRDPMERRFDPNAKTYWTQRRPVAETDRYFRQF